ncbi:unnamed protein product, partial [Sphagnum compactum]
SALVNNNTLACISVRNRFHMHILSQNSLLDETIGKFLLVTEDDKLIADFVDVPKVLGDIFESLIGAVFFDSGNDLQVTWKVIYTLMQNEIWNLWKMFQNNWFAVCLNINQTLILNLEVSVYIKILFRLLYSLLVKMRVLEVYGFGQNRDDAKRAAAKAALQRLER